MADFPATYNSQNAYGKNQETLLAFSGATEGPQFSVIEYEVFKVIFNEDIRWVMHVKEASQEEID